MYKIIDTSEVIPGLEEAFRRYNFILRDIESNVPKVPGAVPYIPGYTDCRVFYDTETYYFCIFDFNEVTEELEIKEFYAPNNGKEFLKEMLKATVKDFAYIYLDIIDFNVRAKRFWFKQFGKPNNVWKSEYWITGYEFSYWRGEE